MYKRILLTTDGSEGAETAVEHAIELAENFEAEVHLLYVVDVRSGSPHDVGEVMSGKFEDLGQEAVENLKERIEDHGINVETEIDHGVPHRSILDYADENSIDMIVMSTRGRTGLDRILIGSVTEKVVRNSGVPVLTVGRNN